MCCSSTVTCGVKRDLLSSKKAPGCRTGCSLTVCVEDQKSVFLTFYVGRQQILFNRVGKRHKNKQEHMGALVKEKVLSLMSGSSHLILRRT